MLDGRWCERDPKLIGPCGALNGTCPFLPPARARLSCVGLMRSSSAFRRDSSSPVTASFDRHQRLLPSDKGANSMVADRHDVVVGVDTHKHTHTAAVLGSTGAVIDSLTVPANPPGYR